MTLKNIIAEFKGKRILVYGDYILDEFLYGQIDRISREAPVFIVSHESSDFRPGCAANTVANLAALDAEVIPCGLIGKDDYGQKLKSILSKTGATTNYLVEVEGEATPLKTRVIAGGVHSIKQQIVRIDRLKNSVCHAASDQQVRNHMTALLSSCHAVLISDYGLERLKLDTALWLLKEAKAKDIPVLVDSRYRLTEYSGATAMTPNQPEAESCLGGSISTLEELHAAGHKLREKMDVTALVITRGSEGMSVFREGLEPVDINAFGDDEVVDVTGAGDTVISAFSLSVASGLDFSDAARIANIAGGLTVLKKGTCTVSSAELEDAIKEADLKL